MRILMVVNTKGGTGKSTLSTNIASYYACWGIRVCLMDLDPQRSSMDWLRARPADRPEIQGIATTREQIAIPSETDYLVMDVPAGMHGDRLERMVALADTVIIPVLPSPMDIRAAGRFLFEFSQHDKVQQKKMNMGLVANRVKENTRIFRELESCLQQVTIPLITHFRESQNYIRAAARGLGIFELPTRTVAKDLVQWKPLIDWINAGKCTTTLPPIEPVDEP